MFKLHKHLFIVSLTLLSGACAMAQSNLTSYKCHDLAEISVQWQDDKALLQIGKTQKISLAHVRAASGARYANNQHEIWEHHGELRWTDENSTVRLCKPTLP